jgi:hypothetical protein
MRARKRERSTVVTKTIIIWGQLRRTNHGARTQAARQAGARSHRCQQSGCIHISFHALIQGVPSGWREVAEYHRADARRTDQSRHHIHQRQALDVDPDTEVLPYRRR